jgi:hypothetical protein
VLLPSAVACVCAADYNAAMTVYEGTGVREGDTRDQAAAAAAAQKQQQATVDSSQAAAAADIEEGEEEDLGGGGEDVETPAVAPAPAKVGGPYSELMRNMLHACTAAGVRTHMM